MDNNNVISVGIDVGTTTTNIIFSELTIQNLSGISQAPILKVIDKNIIYRSEVFFTPLLSSTDIDVSALIKLIENVYKDAKIEKSSVQTGAVIITGETARKKNADKILQELSTFAGNFVVAIAGSDLESIIAAKGSGSAALSKSKLAKVVNLDIGGGTTNLAYFDNGTATNTTCMDIGGRMIEVKDGNIYRMTEKAQKIVNDYNFNIKINEKANINEIIKFCEIMEKAICEILSLSPKTDLSKYFITNHDWDIDKFDYITFSGGVADFVYNSPNDIPKDPFRYGDIGPILGYVIYKSKLIPKSSYLKVNETQQATVVGAGAYSVDLSGSTIHYIKELLPLKNIPIIKLDKKEEEKLLSGELDGIKNKINWYEGEIIALSFIGNTRLNFEQLNKLADNIIKSFDNIIKKNNPIIIVIEIDMAKSLGITLKAKLKENYPLVCVDNVVVENGDYIDIGTPLGDGMVLPVMIKTLIFNEKNNY
ncbi:ethanolamine ammonia-lyase reactivating factor EutA [Brachyspira aalborgi]|uniref:ethanolamine ammonia-lyase reactivating factor EutA n=1 Tax=Brachyspira aalborgi TaxID=29522 RepID=UPI002664E4B1|nr:ethanolamine ammonia-lyase reactivating factor EutA [Brachyspira aalborgi]